MTYRLPLLMLLLFSMPVPAAAGQPTCRTSGTWSMRFGGEYEGSLVFRAPGCQAELWLSSSRNDARQSCRVLEGQGQIWLRCTVVETTSPTWRPDSFHLRMSGEEMLGSNDDGLVRFDNVRVTRDRP